MDKTFASKVVFQFFGWEVTGGDTIVGVLLFIALLVIYFRVKKQIGAFLFKIHKIDRREVRTFNRYLLSIFGLAVLWIGLGIWNLDYVFVDRSLLYLSVQSALFSIIVYLGGKIIIWIGDHIFREFYLRKKDGQQYGVYDKRNESVIRLVGKWFVYLIVLTAVLKILRFNPEWSMYIGEKDGQELHNTISLIRLLDAIKIILLVRLFLWVFLHFFMRQLYESRDLDDSHRFAINRLIKYFVYLITISVVFEFLGFNLTLLWGSLAALMVGVGLGLQDFIRDFISGIFLLFERSVGVGDTIEVDGKLGRVLSIGTRVSMIETNFMSTLMVPNSKLVSNPVLNWSHVEPMSRLFVEVGVAYGSDVPLVEKLMIEAANEQTEIVSTPPPFVLFADFGENALLFRLVFVVPDAMLRPFVASKLRFAIDEKFRAHDIHIPFPQRDVHIIAPKEGDIPPS